MIQILLVGCNGHMGRAISQACKDNDNLYIAAGVDAVVNVENDFPVYTNIFDVKEKIDIIVDFSHPNALDNIIKFAEERSIPLVVATTGHSQEQKAMIEKASSKIPVLLSANMSLGINLMLDLVKRATKLLYGSFDIEIIEKHHNQKIDAPSGTALIIADAANSALPDNELKYVYERQSVREKRTRDEIGIHSIRGGTITGEHSIIFAGNDEMIEIKHTAVSKTLFAQGALKAAAFLYNKTPGNYNMQDIFD